jgi:membrane protein required for beta-lactamase induction
MEKLKLLAHRAYEHPAFWLVVAILFVAAYFAFLAWDVEHTPDDGIPDYVHYGSQRDIYQG